MDRLAAPSDLTVTESSTPIVRSEPKRSLGRIRVPRRFQTSGGTVPPDFSARFDSIEHARAFCQGVFAWYNHAHRHSGIGYMTPAAVHTGQAPRLYAARQQGLHQAFVAHPERFTRRYPTPPALPVEVGINLPKPTPRVPREA